MKTSKIDGVTCNICQISINNKIQTKLIQHLAKNKQNI